MGQTENVNITHLQFPDYTLFLGNKCWANIQSLKALL